MTIYHLPIQDAWIRHAFENPGSLGESFPSRLLGDSLHGPLVSQLSSG